MSGAGGSAKRGDSDDDDDWFVPDHYAALVIGINAYTSPGNALQKAVSGEVMCTRGGVWLHLYCLPCVASVCV